MSETNARFIIVDDEPSIRTSLSLVLAEIGYPVRTAADGFPAEAKHGDARTAGVQNQSY